VGIEIGEFWRRYHTPLSAEGVFILEEREQRDRIAHARTALGLGEANVVVGQFKVSNIVSEFAMVVIMTVCRYSCPRQHSTCWRTAYAQQMLMSRSAIAYMMLRSKPG